MDMDVAEWDTQDRLGCCSTIWWPVLSPSFWEDRDSAQRPKGPRQCVLELELGTSLE